VEGIATDDINEAVTHIERVSTGYKASLASTMQNGGDAEEAEVIEDIGEGCDSLCQPDADEAAIAPNETSQASSNVENLTPMERDFVRSFSASGGLESAVLESSLGTEDKGAEDAA
jgi:hypothetical protein